jgi:hypothetical protein
LDVHVYLFSSHPLLKLKKKAQGVQLAIENCSFLGRANALIPECFLFWKVKLW